MASEDRQGLRKGTRTVLAVRVVVAQPMEL